MNTQFSIKVYKQYFNFAAAHFLVFNDGSREPLHGHNYRVQVKGSTDELRSDMVFDFLDLKPIVRQVCDSLDHKILLPAKNPHITLKQDHKNLTLTTSREESFSFPVNDALILPIENTSAERLAIHIACEVKKSLLVNFQFEFSSLLIEVEETPGQSAEYTLKRQG